MSDTALQAALNTLPTTGTEEELVLAAKARGLMIGYDAKWRDAKWETIGVEEVFHLPVVNPETGAKSRTFTQAGKYDGIVGFSGRTYLLEHKTTSDDISDPTGTYFSRLAIDSQVSAYVLANWQSGRKLDGTLYDVIKKPGIRPKNLSKADRAHIASGGEYFGFKIPRDVQFAVSQTQDRECPELYACRLARDTIENPEKYFARKMIPRLDAEVTEYAGELWEVGQSIISARARDAHYRNSGACVEYNTPCAYLGICSGFDTPDSDKWEVVKNRHPELPIIGEDGGKDVLTNSRIKCFQSCRRRHLYKYELGIRRRDDEERESLYFGSLIHTALEAWWDCFRKVNTDGNCTDAALGNEQSADTAAAQA